MSRSIRKALRLSAAALAIALGGIAGVATGGGGATGTGYMAFGAISDFGSIFVNGIEFFTQKAAITVNGIPNRSESDLKIGMVLTVNGTVDSSGTKGNAATVVYQSDALGMVDRAPAGNELGVLGQSVTIGARTVFAGFISLDQLQVGDFVEVSGFPSAGGLLASRIERKPSVPMVQLKGAIGNVAASTFSLGSITVDYSFAARKNFPSGGLVNGLDVVVNGPAPGGSVLTATSVEVLNTGLGGNANGSLSGVIAAAGGSAITVNGHAVSVTSTTQYVNGNAADLAAGRLVKVDYSVSGSVAVATRIEFLKLDAPAQVEGDVTAKSGDAFEVLGPGGASVTFNALTEWKDQSDARLQPFALANLAVGDHVQLRGNQVDVATLLASRIIRQRPSPSIFLSGRTLSVAAPAFTVIDIEVTTDLNTAFRDESGTTVTAAAFFAKAAGHNVDVSAFRRADGAIVAIQVRMS
jgi:hypothetical protein